MAGLGAALAAAAAASMALLMAVSCRVPARGGAWAGVGEMACISSLSLEEWDGEDANKWGGGEEVRIPPMPKAHRPGVSTCSRRGLPWRHCDKDMHGVPVWPANRDAVVVAL